MSLLSIGLLLLCWINFINLRLMKRLFLIFLMALCNLISVATPVDKYKLLSSLRMTEFYIASGNYEKASTSYSCNVRDDSL